MGMDKSALEAAARQKAYEERLDELRRRTRARTQESLDKIQGDISEHSKKYDQAYEGFAKIVEEHQRLFGTESFSTLVMQMGPSLQAFSKMSAELRMFALLKVHFAIASNVNYGSSPGWILEVVAEASHLIQAEFEKGMDLLGELPPVFVPYLADVADNGVLSVNLDVPNTQMTEADRREFVRNYQADFEATVNGWINNSRTPAGEPMQIVQTNEGPKIEIRPVPVEPGGAALAPRLMTKDEFREFRAQVLEPELERHFTVDFEPETSNNMRRGP